MDETFAEDLIKGKIAEIIFAQMFRDAGKYSVIPFGYENIMPELINCKTTGIAQRVKENISTAPDFALILHDEEKEEIYLVEVKYRSRLNSEKLEELAETQNKRWHPSWIFLATPHDFYFDYCTNIINHHGEIAKLGHLINGELQEKYLALLNKFEQ
jgi:hypothetical protein